ncbi:putative F-box domain-containing protein [Medicago truncatula]|uniref:F-box protein interaction domain protein n=1 Tax=Medicago truncatula TaxID=3880 RepID=G7KVV0_MEDTR|nr:F-box/kelch-repeat protein At3g23880 [Medicago truncatula]AES78877.1 F-box protein interaction domain protein [Medicago truncatula]RHN45635.1 putative F-box domain-containing protein [Medicago truncatula]
MNLRPQKSQRPPNSMSLPTIFLPDELIVEVLSFLPVKTLMRLRSCCKSWNSLVSDPLFVKSHLQRSTQNPNFTLGRTLCRVDTSVLPISFDRFIESSCSTKPITLTNDPYYSLKDKDCSNVVGSYNGLICLLGYSFERRQMWFRFWNPATRTISDKLGHFRSIPYSYDLTFGYDNEKDTYKVVNLYRGAKVFSLGDNAWRNIQSFPVEDHQLSCDGVHLRGIVNYLAIRNYYSHSSYDCKDLTVEQFVIISLDLGTETYKYLLPPRGFVEVPFIKPSICLLMDCLCFSHVVKQTHLVIWKMTDYGVQESWTQLRRIDLQIIDYNLEKKFHSRWLPLHLSKNYDALVVANDSEELPVVYNLIDHSVKRTRIINGERWWHYIKNYSESLVLFH